MSYTQGQLDTLRAAYASGVMAIRYADGKEVKYNSMSEMAVAIARIESALAAQTTGGRATHTTAGYNRGM
jgi:hypothetical protein